MKNGILAANNESAQITLLTTQKDEMHVNAPQAELQKRYDKGEISFEDYKTGMG